MTLLGGQKVLERRTTQLEVSGDTTVLLDTAHFPDVSYLTHPVMGLEGGLEAV